MHVRQFKVFMAPDIGDHINKTLLSGMIGQGGMVDLFESLLSSKLNTKNILTVNSGTSALQLALHLLNSPGKQVFTTPLTCFATTAAIINSGMKPFWIDVDPGTCNMDLNELEAQIEIHKPAAIMVVHYAGYPVNLRRLHKIAGDTPVIEDCAHAIGAYVPEGHVGTLFGNYGCFSFQGIKTLTTGDGGAIVLPSQEYQRAKKLRWFGLDRTLARSGQDIDEVGFKYHMNDIAATIGITNLRYLGENLKKQKSNVKFFQERLPAIAPNYEKTLETSGWLYPVQVENAKAFNLAMRSRGIETGLGHDRNDTYSCLKDYKWGELPGLETTVKSVSCIPSGWWLSDDEKEYIVEAITKGW